RGAGRGRGRAHRGLPLACGMRILATGAGGMLGLDILEAAIAAGHEVAGRTHSELDIADADACQRAIESADADAVINCAAYTNVDGAESDPETAHSVNGAGAGNIARAAARAGAWTVHVSSDYVFDGRKRTPYLESDPTGPLSVYGASKLAGELAVAGAAPGAHTIVRSSWLFGAGGPCFPATMLRLAGERDELTVVDDQVGCPTFTGDLAQALVAIAADHGPQRAGVMHVAAEGECSWFELAAEILASAGASTVLEPGSTAKLGRPAPRPAYSVMRSERGEQVPRLPHWRQGLSRYLAMRVPAR
ncbi:MAG: dTDP-4-dehydrorhamnose reductase, partial [Solirubrobacteraceae bacterium]